MLLLRHARDPAQVALLKHSLAHRADLIALALDPAEPDAVRALAPEATIAFAGTREKMEWQAVPRAGYAVLNADDAVILSTNSCGMKGCAAT